MALAGPLATVQVDDYFYFQIFSLHCYLDHLPPLSPFIVPHNFLSLCPVTTGLKSDSWLSQSISHCPSGVFPGWRKKCGGSQGSEKKNNPHCSCHYSELPSHKVLPKPLLCHLKTFTLRMSLLPGDSTLKFVWSWSPPNRHPPLYLCSNYTQAFFLDTLLTWGWDWAQQSP